jgi:hypothetical protein
MIRKVPRSAAACLALVAMVSAVAGCGGSTSAPATSASATATATATSEPITKAQATAYAHAVNLRAADLPGMSIAAPEGEHPASGRLDQVERCAGNVNPDLVVANIHSASFTGTTEPEHEQIRSVVEVMPNAAIAEQNNAANRSQRALACAKRFFPLELGSQNGGRVHYGAVTVSRLPSPLAGVPGSLGYRVAVNILGVPKAIEPTQPRLYVDAFAFLSGPAEVALVTTAFPQPVSEETESRLLLLLHSRAEASKL